MISLQDERKELFQWDTNRYIILNDQIGDAAEIHFANGVFSRSIDVKIEDGKALIPDVLLQYARPLKVWVFVGEASDGYTKVEHVFKVNERNKPSDYVFTPTEQLSLQELIEKFEDFQDSIGNEVEEYLKENPVKVTEDDPTVPQWAKEEEKPKYTAEEVGARSKDWLPTTEEIGAQPKGNYALKSEIPTIPNSDKSLSIDGAFADAKIVGENIKRADKRIDDAEAELDNKQPKGDYALKSDIPQIPEAPVQSVNGKTGAVNLTAKDVGALPSDTQIPAPYTLPTASAEVKGGVRIGPDFVMDGDVLGVKPEGNYELIETITLEEDGIKSIVRDVSLNGLMVLAKFVKASDVTNVFMEISCVGKAITGSGFIRTDGETSARFNAQKKGGYWDLYSQGYVTGWGSGYYYGQNSAADVLYVTENPQITSIRLYAADGIGEFTKGSVIEIWGVRADA